MAVADLTSRTTLHDSHPGPPGSSLLVQALAEAARALGSDLDWERAGRLVRDHSGEFHGRPGAAMEVLARAASELGMRMSVRHTTAGQLAELASRETPCFAPALNGEKLDDILLVRGGNGRGLTCASIGHGGQPEFRRWNQLPFDGSTPVTVAQLQAVAPLEEHADADHGEHPWHGLHPFQRLREWMQPEAKDLWVAVIYSAAVGVLSLVVPIATQALVNTIAFGMVLQPLLVLSALVFLGLGFAGLLRMLRAWVVEVLERRVFVRISTDVVFRLLRVRIEAFDRGYGPELVNRFFEVATVQKASATLIVDGLTVLMQTLVGLAVMAAYDPILLGFDILLLFLVWLIFFPMSSGAVSTAVKESKAKYAMAAWLEELARHPTTFKGASGAAFAIERADSLVGHYLAERSKHFRVLLRQYGATLILQAVGVSALLGVGGFLVIGNRLTIGQLIAAELIVTTVLSSLTKFSKQLSLFYDLLAAVDKIGYFTDLPLEKSGREPVRTVAGGARVTLSNVAFNYEARPGGVLEGISVTLEAGSRIGITAGTGGGKSTLLDLIYGLRLPVSGALEYDGQDYRELRLGDLRSQIARVGEPEIFAGTIVDNIRLGNAGLSLAGIREALQAVGLLEDVKTFPDGLQTELVTNGLPLSRKQTVRLALARAIAGQPRLLIIDEMLDWLDEPECGQLLDMLFDRRQSWTLLVATRRQEVLARCERIYRLDYGKLQEVKPLQEVTQ